jgi:hypothetical protein
LELSAITLYSPKKINEAAFIILFLLITIAATAQVDQATSSVFTQGDLSQRVGTKDGVQMKVGGLTTIGDGGGGTFRWDANSTATPVPGKIIQPVISGVPQTTGRWIVVLQSQESITGLSDSLAAVRKSSTTTVVNNFSGGGISTFSDTVVYNADARRLQLLFYTPGKQVTAVKTADINGSGFLANYKTVRDTTSINYSVAPDSTITFIFSGIIKDTSSLVSSGNGTGGGVVTPPPGPGGISTPAGFSTWTPVIDNSCQVKFGAQNSLPTASANMIAMANTGVSYAKVAYNGTGLATYTSYTAGGYNVLLSYNPTAPVSGGYSPLPTDTLAFRNNLIRLINSNGSTNLIGTALITEWNSIQHGKGYWKPTSAQNMINLLHAGINALHELGLKAYDGGISDDIMRYLVWRDYNTRGFTDSAASFASRAFPAGTNLATWESDTSHGYRIVYTDSVLTAMQTLPLDGVNVHFFETVLDADSNNATINPLTFKQIVRYLHRKTGKPVITNEFGVNNNSNIDILSQLIDAVEDLHDAKNGDMSIALCSNAIANSDGTLTPFGAALQQKLSETHIDN